MTERPRLLSERLAEALAVGDHELANAVLNLLLHDVAWIIYVSNVCRHEECLQDKVESTMDVLRSWVDDMREGKQRLDLERAGEIAEAAVARALRRDEDGK